MPRCFLIIAGSLICLSLIPTINAQVNHIIFNGGSADGQDKACFAMAANNSIFRGGLADGQHRSCFIQAANNSIFAGGLADGNDRSCFVQIANNSIFAGGIADGHHRACFAQLSNNAIFTGGLADGHDKSCFIQSANNTIFFGGIADGTHRSCFAQLANNAIFLGGIADGHHRSCFIQASNNLIFRGGISDGHDRACSSLDPIGLPIELISFTGKLDGDHALLTWITVNEIDNDYFILERSLNGFDFEEVDQINGAGNSTETLIYQYTDPVRHLFGNPVVYYRLTQVDFDGTASVSPVIAINLPFTERDENIALYPNPASLEVIVRYEGDWDEEFYLRAFNTLGSLVYEQKVSSIDLKIGFPININTWVAGTYHIQVLSSQTRFVKTLIKVGP